MTIENSHRGSFSCKQRNNNVKKRYFNTVSLSKLQRFFRIVALYLSSQYHSHETLDCGR